MGWRTVCLYTLAVGIAMAAATRTAVPAVEAAPHTCSIGAGLEALCATYPVWEDREHKSGRRIGLNIVILPALESNKAADALFLFHGGPGAAATDLALPYSFRRDLRARRDIVMIDQRGTGRSNPLDCELYGDPPDLQKVVNETFPVEAFRACRARLEKIADLRLYTTELSVEDFDDVRRWLHYEKIDIWGGSYGTVTAQAYLRRYGANVRSVALVGVAPVDELLPLHHAWAGQRAVDEIFRRCLANSACETAFPHVREEFQAIFEKVRHGVDVEVQSRTGARARVRPSLEYRK
jgi:pimeloyl-ACP methyl ester carboxylesterase